MLDESDQSGEADLAAEYQALRQRAGWAPIERDVVRVTGPDAAAFLQGQLSQDVAALATGASAWSLLLQPQGRIDAWLRVTRTGADEFLLDVDGGFGEAVLSRLGRFKLRTRCDLDPLDWSAVAVRGPDIAAVASPPGGLRVDAAWPGSPGVDLLGPDAAGPEGVPRCGAPALEAVRIEAGVPRMGAELNERTIPAEAGRWLIESSVSFTKGCYTGQELVARIDSRGGNVPRQLRGVVMAGPGLPPVGAEVRSGDGTVAGTLTSVALSPGLGAAVALAFAKRGIEPPVEVTVSWPGGEAPGRLVAVPLVG